MDSRQVLKHLNEMGYQNISKLELKEFIRDLKKLALFDRRCATPTHSVSELETLSSSPGTPHPTSREELRTMQSPDLQPNHTSNKSQQTESPPQPKANKENKKPRDTNRRRDPVTLYHDYQKYWKKFEKNIPGEKRRSEVRWSSKTKSSASRQS